MMPGGTLDLTGVASYELFFRGALDKIGVFPDLLHIGEYKTFSNTFTEKGFTPAHREMTQSLNHDWYDQLVKAIAESRRRPEAEVVTAINDGPYLAEGARDAGLVDTVAYQDQIDDTAPVKGTRPLDGDTYARVPLGAVGLGEGQKIALLYATGTIASGNSSYDSPTGAVLGSETFTNWLRKVRVDPAIRAIVVRIDSPGGSAIASEAIWRQLMLTRNVKPLVVSMGNVAASGGYYIAVPAQTIVAEPGTITGSIGVVTGKFVVKGTLDKLGISEAAVSEGRFAQIESPFSVFSKEERAKMQEQLHATYDLFLVARGRGARHDAGARGRRGAGPRVDRPTGPTARPRGRARGTGHGDSDCQAESEARSEQGRPARRLSAQAHRLRPARESVRDRGGRGREPRALAAHGHAAGGRDCLEAPALPPGRAADDHAERALELTRSVSSPAGS